MTWDQAMLFPMFEMAGERHHYFEEINYVYNLDNSISDFRIDINLQFNLSNYIRQLPPYSRLEDPND